MKLLTCTASPTADPGLLQSETAKAAPTERLPQLGDLYGTPHPNNRQIRMLTWDLPHQGDNEL